MKDYLDSIKTKRDEASTASEKEAFAKSFSKLATSVNELLSSLETAGTKKLDKDFIKAVKSLEKVSQSISDVKVSSDKDLKRAIRTLSIVLNNLDLKPTVKVAAPQVNVQEREIDFTPVIKALDKIEVKAPSVDIDTKTLEKGIEGVKRAIAALEFPIPNYVLPFKDQHGKATQAQLDANGAVPVSGSITVLGGTGTSELDDADFTPGTTAGTPAMGVYESSPTNVTDNDLGIVGITQGRRLKTSATVDSALPAGTNNIGDVDIASLPNEGQQTMANSISVAVASNQSAVPISDDGGSLTVDTTSTQDLDLGGGTATRESRGTMLANFGGTNPLADHTAYGDDMTTGIAAVGVRLFDGTDYDRWRGDATNGADVDVTRIGGQTPSFGAGSVAAGTQRVTLASDDPGVASLSVLDDWDESDRAKVNPIVGQAGVQGGSGMVSNTTQRVVLATDVALPAGTNAIGKLAANSGVDIGDVDVTSAVSATMDHGSNLDIDTSAEQITATSFACKFGVTLRADTTNTGILYIGNSDVTAGSTAATDGIPLSPGDSLFLPVSNSNIPYAIASANNQKIYWVAV